MSEHNGNGMNSGNGEAFEDAELSALYQQTRAEQPSAKSDEAILALAKQHTHKQPHAVSPFSARWPITASMVAVLVIGFGLVMLMKTELGPEQTLQPSTSIKVDEGANEKIEVKREQLSQQQLSRQQLAQKRKSAPQPTATKSGSAGMLAAPELAAKPSQPTEQLQSEPILSPQPMVKQEKPAPVPNRAMNLSDNAVGELQALKKDRQAESQSTAAARLKAPQAAIVMKKKSGPAAPEAKALSGVTQGLVSEDAMQSLQKSPTACNGKLVNITAQDYWPAYIAGDAQLIEKDRSSACVMIDAQGRKIYKQISLPVLQDRTVKQQSYKTLLKENMQALADKKLKPTEELQAMEKLKRLTGLSFTGAEEWLKWYEASKDSLVLSRDGQYLVNQIKSNK